MNERYLVLQKLVFSQRKIIFQKIKIWNFTSAAERHNDPHLLYLIWRLCLWRNIMTHIKRSSAETASTGVCGGGGDDYKNYF